MTATKGREASMTREQLVDEALSLLGQLPVSVAREYLDAWKKATPEARKAAMDLMAKARQEREAKPG